MNDYQIPLSKTPLTVQIITSGALVMAACVFATLFFDKLVSFAPNLQSLLLTTLWIVLPLLWLLGSVYAYKTWPKANYILLDEALRVQKKGLFGATAEQLYRYESILTTGSSTSMFGEYGTIKLTLSQLDPIIIHGVVNPEEQTRKIKEMIAKGQPKIQAIPR